MTTPTRATVLVLAALFLLPLASAAFVVAPQQLAQRGDYAGRDYVAVAAGSIDPTLGDLLVLTTEDCSRAGCPRDVWFRFLNAPSNVSSAGEASRYLQHVGGRALACAAGEPVTVDQSGCWRPRSTTPGFHDIPLATTPADETDVVTDGRYVVFASGPVGGPYDVYRFDARNRHLPPVAVATSAEDERPFGVAGGLIGVRVANGDGTDDLRIVDLAGPDVDLATVPSTSSAALSSTRAAWDAGASLTTRAHANGGLVTLDKTTIISATVNLALVTGFSDVKLAGDRLVYTRTSSCTTLSPADCNTRVSPARKVEVVNAVVAGTTYTEPATPLARSTATVLPGRPVVFQHPSAAAQATPAALVAWFSLDLSGAPTEKILVSVSETPPAGTSPCAWGLGLPQGVLHAPAFSKNYVTQLDHRATGTSNCPVTNPGSNVAVYAAVKQ